MVYTKLPTIATFESRNFLSYKKSQSKAISYPFLYILSLFKIWKDWREFHLKANYNFYKGAKIAQNWKAWIFVNTAYNFCVTEYDSKYSWNLSFIYRIDRKINLGLKIFDPVNCRRLDSNLQFLQSSQNWTKLKSMNFCRYCLQFFCD